jgi:hypothetical protein
VKTKGKGTNPNSLKALEPTKWKKGFKPEGAGRPKGALSLKDRMKRYLDLSVEVKLPDGTITDREVLDDIILSLFNEARKGNTKAIEQVLDRFYGKEPEKLEVTAHEDRLKFLDD